jgi:hypothetical protein
LWHRSFFFGYCGVDHFPRQNSYAPQLGVSSRLAVASAPRPGTTLCEGRAVLTLALAWPDWFTGKVIYVVLLSVSALGFFRFWAKTRFWLPRYVHVLALIALLVSIWVSSLTSPEAPVNQGDWAPIKRLMLVLALPAMVYFFFVFYGGQREAYDRTHRPLRCQNCGAEAVAGLQCPSCGQMPKS